MNKIFCCGKLLVSNFCPDCGKSLKEALKTGKGPYPLKFTTYLHGEGKEDESRQKFIEALGLDTNDQLDISTADYIRRCDYEIGIVWEILNENSIATPIGLLRGNTQYKVIKHEGLSLRTGEFDYD